MSANVQLQAADTLLDIGVSLPFRLFRIPFTRKYVGWRITVNRPYFGSLLRVLRLHLQAGVSYEELQEYSKGEQLQYMAEHGDKIISIITWMICRRKKIVFFPLWRWLVKWFVPNNLLFGIHLQFISMLGVKPFTIIIKSCDRINVLKPNLSHEKKGS